MKVFTTIAETTRFIQELRDSGKKIGFVPTMGALHEGHLDLMRRARQETDVVVVSIFVNPIQFNNKEDLDKYPRETEKDIAKLETVPADILFNPTVSEMYPGEVMEKYDFGQLEAVMEGKFRPGHFNGVAVVVKRLFDITLPHRAYFGEKDFQQLRIVQELVRKENLPLEIIPCKTVREPDGLAMSSRNQRLTPEERLIAPALYHSLAFIAENAFKNPINGLIEEALNRIAAFKVFNVEYLIVSGIDNLQRVEVLTPGNKYVVCIAARLGNVRLIDNVIIG